MRILLIDNYDSFTYNIVHYLEDLGATVQVVRNDHPLPPRNTYDALVLSPGPGLPKDSGALMDIIEKHFGQLPIFGVCLGMQALGEFTGATLYNRKDVRHGRTVELKPTDGPSVLLDGVQNVQVGLYHSWALESESLSAQWRVVATAYEEGAPMAMEHVDGHTMAVQFHPESVLTPEGKKMMENWLKSCS